MVSTLARCDLLSSVTKGLLCKRNFVCVAVSVIGFLPRNEQADGRLSSSLDSNQVRRTKRAFDEDEGRIDPLV